VILRTLENVTHLLSTCYSDIAIRGDYVLVRNDAKTILEDYAAIYEPDPKDLFVSMMYSVHVSMTATIDWIRLDGFSGSSQYLSHLEPQKDTDQSICCPLPYQLHIKRS
jgi:hypothetical protein